MRPQNSEAGILAARSIRPAGVFVLVTAVAGLCGGLAFGWIEALAAGVLAVVLLLCAVPFLLGGRVQAVELHPAHERIVAGEGTEVTVTVRGTTDGLALPGGVDVPVGDGLVEFGVPLLRPGRTWSRVIEIAAQPRGILRLGPVTTVRGDPIGLLRRPYVHEEVRELVVHPRTVALPPLSAGVIRDLEGRPTGELADADMSFHAIREYAPGDARAHIHWKSTAKTGRLMVRQFEQTRRSRLAVVFPAAIEEYADADEFELAVSVAASLGVRALREARDVDVVVGSASRSVPSRSGAARHLPATSARALLDAFSALEPVSTAVSLEGLCAQVTRSDPQLSTVVMIVGSAVDVGRLRLAARELPGSVAALAVVCDARVVPRRRQLGPVAVLTVATLDDLAGLSARGALS